MHINWSGLPLSGMGFILTMKLGFIAMSGIRAHNPELTKLGLTLPGFVERNKVIASLPSLGLLTLAGLTPEHIEVEYLEVPDEREFTKLPLGYDAVAISSFSAQIKEAYRLAERFRAVGVKVILGGLHVSAVPEEAEKFSDAIIIGEGEPLWPQVIRDLEAGILKRRYDARPLPFDLTHAPMPRFDLLEPNRYNRYTVQTQRGCPFNCEFCAASVRISPQFKVKPVEKVIAEIRHIKEFWKTPFIEFADDNTFANKKHGRELVRALGAERVRWFTETDISVADDEVLLDMMKESGCAQILIGLESPTKEGIDGLELKANWKRNRLDQYRRTIERIQDRGITVNGCFVLGLDHTDRTSFERVWEFVRSSGLFEVQITVMTAFPGTPLYHRLKSEGRILRDRAWELCTLFDVNFRPERMSVEELEVGFRGLAEKLYSQDFTMERRRRFFKRQRALKRRAKSIERGPNLTVEKNRGDSQAA